MNQGNAVGAGRASLPQLGELVAGKYQLQRQLGVGGMGAVFEARHQLTGKRFAIKVLLPELGDDPEFVQRFLREARIGGSLEHPHLVEVYDVGSDRGSLFMVMELLEGESLAARIAREGQLAPAEACRILLPCVRAIARAHAAGIVHRDLKPENIFLCASVEGGPEHPKVLDFGISKIAKGWSELDATLTKSGTLIGTVSYMPLEQLLGKVVDQRVDVYALGVILYELLSGHLPFTAATFGGLAVQLATETPLPLEQLLPGAPPELCALVQRALVREPDQRLARVDDMARVLQAHLHDQDWQQVIPLSVEFAATALSHARAPRPDSGYRATRAGTAQAVTPALPPTLTPVINVVNVARAADSSVVQRAPANPWRSRILAGAACVLLAGALFAYRVLQTRTALVPVTPAPLTTRQVMPALPTPKPAVVPVPSVAKAPAPLAPFREPNVALPTAAAGSTGAESVTTRTAPRTPLPASPSVRRQASVTVPPTAASAPVAPSAELPVDLHPHDSIAPELPTLRTSGSRTRGASGWSSGRVPDVSLQPSDF